MGSFTSSRAEARMKKKNWFSRSMADYNARSHRRQHWQSLWINRLQQMPATKKKVNFFFHRIIIRIRWQFGCMKKKIEVKMEEVYRSRRDKHRERGERGEGRGGEGEIVRSEWIGIEIVELGAEWHRPLLKTITLQIDKQRANGQRKRFKYT